MPSFDHFFLPVLLFFTLSFLTHTTAVNFLFCIYANTTFSGNNIYNANLNSFLFSLSSHANNIMEFYNTNSGENTSDPIYGLFLCRGDVTAKTCRACLVDVAKNLASCYFEEKAAIILYNECMLRYSNQSIFSIMAVRSRVALINTQTTISQGLYNELVFMMIMNLAKWASGAPIGAKKFEILEVNLVPQILYLMVQCTPNLSSNDCYSCLQAAINRFLLCYGGREAGRVLFPSCNFSYEYYSFFAEPTSAPILCIDSIFPP